MSNLCNFYGFRNFCISNFPFLEKDFDAITDYELICKIFEYFEKQIKEIDEKYSDILDLRQEFDLFKVQIMQTLNDFENNINEQVDYKIQQNYSQILQLMSDYQTLFNNQLLQVKNDLEAEIESIELGNVMAYNPTTR